MLKPNITRTGTCSVENIRDIPQETGVYTFVTKRGTVLYAGKAKRLSHRVRTYFTRGIHHPRLRRLSQEASAIRYFVTATELDALLLEDDLIKRHRPSFNRTQKDHYSSVYVRVSRKEPYLSLAIEPTRDEVRQNGCMRQNGSIYYGPFKDPWRMKALVDLLSDYVGFRRSLLYQDFADQLTPRQKITVVKAIFEGKDLALLHRLIRRRNIQSRLLHFESAARTQEKIRTIQTVQKWIHLLKRVKRPIQKSEIDKLIILSRHLSSI